MMHSRFWIQNIKSQFFTDNAFLGMENNEKLIEVINILEKMEFYISDEPTYYYYSNNSIDTRANVYYENIGLFKIYIEVDNKHADYAIITIEKIRRTEIDTRRIQDLTDELDSNWENVFLKKILWE